MSTRIAIFSLCLMLFLIISTSAFAAKKIERSCDAHYEIIVTNINGTTASKSSQVHKFYARRGCGKSVPNRCRERARDAAHSCMQKHWETRWERTTPTECRSEGVKNYEIQDLKAILEKEACTLLGPSDYSNDNSDILFTTKRVTRGDNKCGKSKEIVEDYSVSCSCPFGKACGGE